MTTKKCTICDLNFSKPSIFYQHRQDFHTLEAVATCMDGKEVVIIRKLKENFVCLCKLKFESKSGLYRHVSKNSCSVIKSIKFKGVDNVTSIKYDDAVISALNIKEKTMPEKKNSRRLVKVLDLKPITLKEEDGTQYPLLGSQEVIETINVKKRITVNTVTIKPNKKTRIDVNKDTCDLDSIINFGQYASLVDYQDYQEVNSDVLDSLNKDWYIYDNYKYFCCLSMAGAIAVEGSKAIMINTVEAYGRTPSTDIHHERFLNGKAATTTTLPPPNTLYNNLWMTIVRDDNSRKLIIASKSMNLLVTQTIRLDHEVKPEIGSSTMDFTPSSDTRLFLLKSQITEALDILKVEKIKSLYPFDILSQLRQIRSKFHHVDSYLTLRASSPLTNQHNLKPYTIWTLANYDDTSTTTSSAKIASTLFQKIAKSVLLEKVIKKHEVKSLAILCKNTQIKGTLDDIVKDCFEGENLFVINNQKLDGHLQELAKQMITTIKAMNENTVSIIWNVYQES